MQLLLAKLKTVCDLGLADICTVIFYRLRIRLGVHPVCRLEGGVARGPFFRPSDLPLPSLQPISSWADSAHLFGHLEVPLGDGLPSWLSNPLTVFRDVTQAKEWWKISDFEEATGDIKLVWEQSRMNWVIAFAQRARCGDSEALEKLNCWLSDWLALNPAYYGPNWKCGQEASIRVIPLACAALILGQELQTSEGLRQLVVMHLRRIAPTIDYALAQNNNHGTSEAAALFIGGSWISSLGSPEGAEWASQGRRFLENRSLKLIEDDGSFSQYSLNYHRMMLDTYSFAEIWRRRLTLPQFSSKLYSKAALATSWLYQMVSPINGDGPNIGANDGAHILQLVDSGYRDYRPSVALAMAVFEGRRGYAAKGQWDLHLEWLGVECANQKPLEFVDCNYDQGGYKILRNDAASVFFRYPKFRYRPSQADALHLDLWVGGDSLLRDAGSYSYNSTPDLSWYFSGTSGHNTIQFDGRDQMPRFGRFLFGSWLKPLNVTQIKHEGKVTTCSAGYRDYKGAEHRRSVKLGQNGLCVIDEVRGFENTATLRWRLPDGLWNVECVSGEIQVSGVKGVLTIAADVPISRAELVEGWISMFYMKKEIVPVLEVEIAVSGRLTSQYRWSE